MRARVTHTQTDTKLQFTAVTNGTGYFDISGTPAGTYTVTIEAPKFSKVTMNNVLVNSGVATGLGARILQVGAETVVTVEEATPLVQTDTMNISGTFDTKKAADLPMGNAFDALALVTPGIAD